MADISMQYSGIESAAGEILRMHDDFGDMLTELDALASSLEGIWEGKAQQEFALAYRDLKPKLEKIGELLDGYCTELTGLVGRQQSLESVSRDMMRNLILKSEE